MFSLEKAAIALLCDAMGAQVMRRGAVHCHAHGQVEGDEIQDGRKFFYTPCQKTMCWLSLDQPVAMADLVRCASS